MQVAVLDDAAFRLDHERYAYAGKFVVPGGKAVALADGASPDFPDPREGYAEGVLGAIVFSADRTDEGTVWLRYVTVRRDRRGEGIGTRLAAETTARLHDREYGTVRIAVNNPYSYEALSKAGFGFTGEETGLAELVMDHPSDRERYDAGLALFAERDLTDDERAFLREKRARGPPAVANDES